MECFCSLSQNETHCFCLSRAHKRFWGCYGWTDQCSNARLEYFDFPLEFWRSINNSPTAEQLAVQRLPPVLRFFSRDEELSLSLWFSFLLRLAIFLCDPWCSPFGSSSTWLLSYFTPLICLHQTSETQQQIWLFLLAMDNSEYSVIQPR